MNSPKVENELRDLPAVCHAKGGRRHKNKKYNLCKVIKKKFICLKLEKIYSGLCDIFYSISLKNRIELNRFFQRQVCAK